MTRAAAALALAALALTAPAGCDKKQAEPNGIGKWSFSKTTRKDATGGVCQPTELADGRKATWCYAMTPLRVAESAAEVDLYFDGAEPTSPLIEIQLKVRGCNDQALEDWLRAALGPPIETRSTRAYWKNSFMWVAALMPSDPGRCRIHMLPLSEAGEINRIKQR